MAARVGEQVGTAQAWSKTTPVSQSFLMLGTLATLDV